MQPHDSDDQRPEEGNSDGGRYDEWSAIQAANRLVYTAMVDLANGPVHLAEPDKPLNLSANVSGSGGVKA